jgi:hypothetical protein
VTGVGNEIDAHLLGRGDFASINEADQQPPVGERCASHQPVPTRLAQPGKFDALVSLTVPFQRFKRARVRHDLTYLRALEGFTKQCSRSNVCSYDVSVFDEHRWFSQAIQQRSRFPIRTHRGGIDQRCRAIQRLTLASAFHPLETLAWLREQTSACRNAQGGPDDREWRKAAADLPLPGRKAAAMRERFSKRISGPK